MTEQEAINVLLENVPKCCKMVDGRYQGGFDDWDCDMGQAIRVAVLALQDVRNYQKIGTVEEVMQKARDLKRQTEHSEHLAEVLKATQNLLEKRERLLKEYCKIGTVEECREAVANKKKCEKQWHNDMENPLEPIKVYSALKSEILKLELRIKNRPKDISILDYTVIAALQKVLKNNLEGMENENT